MPYPVFNPRGHFGSAFTPPQAIQRLPVDLLRTSLTTRDPRRFAGAVEQFRSNATTQDFQPAMILPQGMALEMHKRGPGGIARGERTPATASAMGYASAMRQSGSGLREIRQTNVPGGVQQTYEMAAVKGGSNAMSQPAVDYPPEQVATPRVRPLRQPISAPLEAYGTAVRRMEQEAASYKAVDSGRAMREVAQMQDAQRRYFHGR
jgi:hypothetical protein